MRLSNTHLNPMASTHRPSRLLSALSCLFPLFLAVLASDPDPLFDFCVTLPGANDMFFNGLPCKNPADATSADFTSSLLGVMGDTANPLGIAISLAGPSTVGGLNTLGLVLARIDYAEGGLVPPHVHPRASEVLVVTQGTIYAGFIDTTDKLFSATLKAGDLIVFPKGLVHFSLNIGKGPATSLSSLTSQNPGVQLVANALFGAQPPVADAVLVKAFQLSVMEVQRLKKAFAPKP